MGHADLLKEAYRLLSWRVLDGSAIDEEEALFVLLAPLFTSPPVGSSLPPVPDGASRGVQLPPSGRRAPFVHQREDREIALALRAAGGEWLVLIPADPPRGRFLHNWAQKVNGTRRSASDAFPPGEFQAGVRGNRLFARWISD